MKLTEAEKVRRRWVRALRSGEYKQTTGRLRRGDNFCCLGVLCDLAVKAGVIDTPQLLGEGHDDTWDYDGNEGMLPDSVAEWAGMRTNGGSFDNPITTKKKGSRFSSFSLIDLNDTAKKTFKGIATIIESKPEGLFIEE